MAARRIVAVALLVATVATLIDLGSFHRLHNGDSLVPILMSLYRWQPFMWEQDRFGMFLPLLTSVIPDPFLNLLATTWLTCFTMLLGFFALAWIAVGPRAWIATGALAAAIVLDEAGEFWRFMLLGTSMPNYGLALMALGAAVGLAGERPAPARIAGSALLLVLGAWVHSAAAFVVVPAILLRGLLSRSERRAAMTRAALVAGLAVGALLVSMSLSSTAPVRMHYAILPIAEWPACWAGLIRNAHREELLSGPHLGVLGVLAAIGALAISRGPRAGIREALGAFLPLFAGAVCLVLVIGTLNWTRSQELAARYLLPAVVTLDVAVVGFCVAAVLDRIPERARPWALGAAPAAMVLVAAALYFPPSLHGVRSDIDRTLGTRTPEVLEAGITHVAGSYWTVWPTVFHANLVLHAQGSPRRVWGVAHRASATADQWARIPVAHWRVAAIPEEFQDPWTATVYRNYGLPALRPIGRMKTFTVFVPEPAKGP